MTMNIDRSGAHGRGDLHHSSPRGRALSAAAVYLIPIAHCSLHYYTRGAVDTRRPRLSEVSGHTDSLDPTIVTVIPCLKRLAAMDHPVVIDEAELSRL